MSGVEAPVAAGADDLTRAIEQAVAERDVECMATRYWLEIHGVSRIFRSISIWAARRLVQRRVLPVFIPSVHDLIAAKAGRG